MWISYTLVTFSQVYRSYHHLFIACSNWLCDLKIKSWMKASFSWMRDTLFCQQFSPQNAESCIFGLWNVKIFWGSIPPNPLPHHRKSRLMAPCWYSRLLYSNLPANSIFIETPDSKRGFSFKRKHNCCLLLLLNFLGCHINYFSRCHLVTVAVVEEQHFSCDCNHIHCASLKFK